MLKKHKLIYYFFSYKFDEKGQSKEETSHQCKYCKYSGKHLMMHLSTSKKGCKEKYGEVYNQMKESKAKEKQEYNKNYIKTYDSEHKEEALLRKRKYRNDHRDEINEKQHQYYNTHKEEMNEKEKKYRKKNKREMTKEDRFKAFRKDIIDGPNFTCFSCNRDLFKNGVRFLNAKKIETAIVKYKLKEDFVKQIGWNQVQVDDTIVCHTCFTHIKQCKLPSINVLNGLHLDVIPEELQLTDLEQQLIARSLIFMKVKKLPRTGLGAVTDKVISVPIEEKDVTKTVTMLPRNIDDAKIVAVKLKRKLEMKNSHLEAYIRPAKVIKAVETLKELGNQFYQDVTIDKEFTLKQDNGQDNITQEQGIDRKATAEEESNVSVFIFKQFFYFPILKLLIVGQKRIC